MGLYGLYRSLMAVPLGAGRTRFRFRSNVAIAIHH